MPRQHRLQEAYPDLWRAVDGAIRAAMHAHSDIQIPDHRRDSIVKRVVGQSLATMASSGRPEDTAHGQPLPDAPAGTVRPPEPPAVSARPRGEA